MTTETSSSKFRISLTCAFSGLHIGDFSPNVGIYQKHSVDGMSPYVKGWKETILIHPIFSISMSALLHRATSTLQLEKSGKAHFPILQKQLLMLAMLHAGDCIHQDLPCLPSPRITDSYFGNVLEMLGWKQEINSERLHFPKLHIWKGAAREMEKDPFAQIPMWLKLCVEVKEEYENVVRTRQKAAKQQAAVLAMKNIKRNLYEDISIRRLWNWLEVQIPQMEMYDEYKDIFFCAEKNINVWTHDDIDSLEEVFLKYCETGNSISHEVSKHLKQLHTWLSIYEDTFEILIEDKFPELRGKPAPEPRNFPNRAAFLVAQAKWSLAQKAAPAAKVSDEEL